MRKFLFAAAIVFQTISPTLAEAPNSGAVPAILPIALGSSSAIHAIGRAPGLGNAALAANDRASAPEAVSPSGSIRVIRSSARLEMFEAAAGADAAAKAQAAAKSAGKDVPAQTAGSPAGAPGAAGKPDGSQPPSGTAPPSGLRTAPSPQ